MKSVIVATLIVVVVATIPATAGYIKPVKGERHRRPPVLNQNLFMESKTIRNPSCLPTISMIAIDLASVIHNMATTVSDCKKEHNSERCAIDITNVVESVSTLADKIDEAVISCRGIDNHCADDILAAAHDLSEVAGDIANAVPYCKMSIEGQCSTMINNAMEKLGSVVNDIKKSISDCSHVHSRSIPGEIVSKRQTINGDQNPSCASAIGTASVDIAQVVEAIRNTVSDCAKPSNKEVCAKDGANSAKMIGILANDLETAAVACGAHRSDCAEDILSAIKTITRVADYVINAIPLCKNSIEGECSRNIFEAGKDIGEAVVTIKHAIRDCARV